MNKTPQQYRQAIQQSGHTIYSAVAQNDPNLWVPTPALEALLTAGLRGQSVAGLPLRTRSKVVKELVCKALGYPVPASFKRAQPRFPAQNLDIFSQKSRNLQIWNDSVVSDRRYALIDVGDDGYLGAVKVVNGQQLLQMASSGHITTKLQARLVLGQMALELVSPVDTPALRPHVAAGVRPATADNPARAPSAGGLMPIRELFGKLSPLVGMSFADPGGDQERNRGGLLHAAVCRALGYSRFEDNGQFPDVLHQLLEVKLQTAGTIDLGHVQPNSAAPVMTGQAGTFQPRHCDVRYAVFFAEREEGVVKVKNLILATGADFFSRFKRFGGRVSNGKIQILLPADFFGA